MDNAPDFSRTRISPAFLRMLPTDQDRETAIALDKIDAEREWHTKEAIVARAERDDMRARLAALQKQMDETIAPKAEFAAKRNILFLSFMSSLAAVIVSALTAWAASKK